jgi:hypothetical protein
MIVSVENLTRRSTMQPKCTALEGEESVGGSVITAVVSPVTLARVASTEGVVAVEEPRELQFY